MADIFAQNQQQQIEQILRRSLPPDENAVVSSAGGKLAGFVAKVIQRQEYNYYTVKAVDIDCVGDFPTVIGNEITAVNVAESFIAQGNLPAGRYVIIFRIGNVYAFYSPA
jgi:hypothetical protein